MLSTIVIQHARLFFRAALSKIVGNIASSVHLNRPDKKRVSGFGLPPLAVTKIKI